MTNEDLLKEVGLSSWETKTYLALLQLGESTTGPVIEKSQVPRSKIYDVLTSLIAKGLVSYIIKGQIKYFQASDPKRILNMFKEKEKQVENMLSNLNKKEEKHSVELFEGIKAIRIMYLGIIEDIKKGEEWYGFATGKTSDNKEIEDFYEWLGGRRIAAGLKDHLLISLENKQSFLKSASKQAIPFINKITRYSRVSFPGDVSIFRNQVVLLNWEGTPSATLITNADLAKQYKDFFLGLWKVAKK